MAKRAERYHTGEDDGNRRKKVAAKDPSAAKVRSSVFRWGAIADIVSPQYNIHPRRNVRWSAIPPIDMTVIA